MSHLSAGHPSPWEEYLPGQTAGSYRARIARQHPWLEEVIDSRRFEESLFALRNYSNEFDIDGDVGRGDSYRKAMNLAGARSTGMLAVLSLAGARESDSLVLDVLGGNGELGRVGDAAGLPARVITSDAAKHMVSAALDQGRAAIRQLSSELVLHDSTLDGVVVAYGTHHIPVNDLPATVAEARRVLRPNGRLVLHDFEPDGAMAKWFGEVVDVYSPGGHPYEHVGADAMRDLLPQSEWSSVEIEAICDPFEVKGSTLEKARNSLIQHLREMYGISTSGRVAIDDDQLTARISCIFAGDACDEAGIVLGRAENGMHTARIRRMATVGVAVR